MNPVFVFLVITGAVLLWFLLSGLFRFIGGITERIYKKTKNALDDDSPGNIESFVNGFKDSFKTTDKENKG